MPMGPGPTGCCECGSTCADCTICVMCCSGQPSTGLTVGIAALSFSQTVDSSGCVTVHPCVAGTYTITVTGNARYASYSASQTLTCGGTVNITLTPASGFACNSCYLEPIPKVLAWTIDGGLASQLTGTFDWTMSDAFICGSKANVNTIDYDSMNCVTPQATNPCTENVGGGTAGAAFDINPCSVSQTTSCGTDCSNTDGSCTGQTSPWFTSYCSGSTLDNRGSPSGFFPAGPCTCMWEQTVGKGGLAAHYGGNGNCDQLISFGTGLPVPVNINVTFSASALGGCACFPMFSTFELSE
jgi:hypothetical protein